MSSRCSCLTGAVCLTLIAGAVHGEPLPAGAVVRLGSLGLRSPGSVAFSPDGKMLAVVTGISTRKVQFWDVSTGAWGPTLDPGSVSFFRFVSTADGCFFAVGDADEVRLVNATTGKVVRRLKGPGRDLDCLALSPDGKLLAAARGWRGTVFEAHEIVLWDLGRGKERGRLDAHKTWVRVLAFSADGKQLLSSSEDYERVTHPTIRGSVCVWEVANGKLLRQLPQRGKNVSFAAEGTIAACWDKDSQTLLWDLKTDRERARLPGKWLHRVFLPDGKTLVTGGNKEPLCLWSVEGKKLHPFQGYFGDGIFPVGVTPDGKLLAATGVTGIRLWDVATGKERRFFAGHQDAITCLAFAGDGKTLVSGSKDTTLRVWNANSGKELLVYASHGAPITVVTCSPDGKWVASGDASNAVQLWDRSTGKLLHRWVLRPAPAEAGERNGLASLAFAANGKILLAGSGTIRGSAFALDVRGLTVSLDPSSGRIVHTVRESGSVPGAIAPDGRTMASSSLAIPKPLEIESKLLLRNLDSGKVLNSVDEGKNVTFDRAVFSSDSKLLAVRSSSHMVSFVYGGKITGIRCQLREVATGKGILPLAGGTATMTFAPDGKSLIAVDVGKDGFRLLSTATGREIQKFSGCSANCCIFSPEGMRLATGSSDGTVLAWDATKFATAELPAAAGLREDDLTKLWGELASGDAARAYRAVLKLAAVPTKSIPLLRDRLKPVSGASAATIEGHVKNLDSKVFRIREQASAALEKLGEQAIPALRRLLRAAPSLELRHRAERLLAQLERPLSPEQLRAVRATSVLERIGTTEARRTLQTLAGGAPGVCLTEEARASLERLRRLARP